MKNIIIFIIAFLSIECLNAQTGFSVSSGTLMRLNNGAYLVLDQMDFENKGTFSDGANSTIKFTGNSDNGIYASLTLELYNLEISKSAGASILLQKNIVVENNLNINQGKLDLNNFNLNLDGGQIIGEDVTNYITGTSGGFIELTTVLNNPDQENPGNLGIQITSVANLGQTTIRRGHEEQTSNTGGKSIYRWFDINPTNNSGLNATFRVYYFDHELNGIPENELEPWRSTDNGNTWELQDGSFQNTTNNWVQLSGVDAFSRWTQASATSSPLPVELSYFSGKTADRFNLLSWETFSEENVDEFIIEKLKGQIWTGIGRVEAAHFSTERQLYSFEDFEFKTQDYYRLRILDYDRSEDFSPIILIARESEGKVFFEVFPNPVDRYLTWSIQADGNLEQLNLLSAAGQFVAHLDTNNTKIDLSNLPSGLYFLEAWIGGRRAVYKIIKE